MHVQDAGLVKCADLDAANFQRLFRALDAHGGVSATCAGKRVRIAAISFDTNGAVAAMLEEAHPGSAVFDRGSDALWVKLAAGVVGIREVVPEGRKRATARDFANTMGVAKQPRVVFD